MATLTGQTIASSYEQLLHVDRDGGGNTTNYVAVKDGDNGTTFDIELATANVRIPSGNLVIGTAGKGIDFSNQASPAAGMTSELLDRYEEGTWTPVMERVTGGAISASYTRNATYTRIGNLVTAHCSIVTTSVTDGGSSLNVVSGLPFNISSTEYQGVGSVQFNTAFTSTIAHSVTAYTGDEVSFGHVASKLYGNIGEAWVAGALSFTITYKVD